MAPKNKQPSIASCDKCRSLKVKCLRSDTQTTCAKCAKSGHRCNTTDRPRNQDQRVPVKRVHLRDLASRLDGVLCHLSSSDGARSTSNTDGESSSAVTSRRMASVDTDQEVAGDDIIDVQDTEQCEPNRVHIARGSWASRLDLDRWLLGHLLQRYRTMQHHFPFVVIPEAWNLQNMMMSRPTLLLAIVSSSASNYPQLQQLLVKDLKDTLTRRVMVGGENDLELLQALLVHLAWSQYHMVPRSQLIYRYLHIAVSMAVDLHMDTDPSIVARHSLSTNEVSLPLNSDVPSIRSGEAYRTALGCFYLSSVFSLSMIKPSTLPFNDSTFAWAISLAQDAEFPTDATLVLLIQYQRILEDIQDVYQGEKKMWNWSRLPLHAKRMAATLESWWLSVPEHLHLTHLFANRYHYAKIRIYEMGLLFHFRTRDEGIISAASTTAVSTNLLACVDAIKNYLDALLAPDGVEWDVLPCEEWCRNIVALFVLYKLAAGPREILDWDVGMCRSSIDLAKYLDVVADRISHSHRNLGPGLHPNEGLYFVFPAVLRSARSSFMLVRDSPHLVKPGNRVHMDMSKEQIAEEVARPRNRPRCPATAFWTDRALMLDQETDWHKVDFAGVVDPAAQLAKNERLWSDLLGGTGESG